MLYAVLGLPRSGTTIVCNAFNSAENAVCLCEPHWFILGNAMMRDHENMSGAFGRTGIFCTKVQNIYPALTKYISEHKIDYGGVKETYRYWEPLTTDIVLSAKLDFVVAVHRSPVDCFRSWIRMRKKNNWGETYEKEDRYIECYNRFLQRLRGLPMPVVNLKLDCLISGGLDYLTARTASVGKIKFKKPFTGLTEYTFGDSWAKASTEFQNTAADAASQVDCSNVARALDSVYASL